MYIQTRAITIKDKTGHAFEGECVGVYRRIFREKREGSNVVIKMQSPK